MSERQHETGHFSLYKGGIKNTTKAIDTSVASAIKLLQDEKTQTEIERLRSTTDEHIKKVVKNGLSYWTWSGTFKKREIAGLIKHSGLICIDFDAEVNIKLPGMLKKEPVPNITDLAALRTALAADAYTHLLFASPRGNGLKVIVKIWPELHAESFLWLEKYYLDTYKVQIDESGKDVSRACFISYDAEPVHRLFSEVVPAEAVPAGTPPVAVNPETGEIEVEKPTLFGTEKHTVPKKQAGNYNKALFCIDQIVRNKVDITEDYDDWLKIGFSMATFGEAGRELFHKISQFNPEYNYEDCEAKFNNAIATTKFTTPGKFFSICKDYGIIAKEPKQVAATKAEEKEKQKPVRTEHEFWYHIFNPKTEKEEIQIDYLALCEFLNSKGFALLPMNGEEKEYQFIKVEDNIIDTSNELVMKKYTINYLAEAMRDVKRKLLQGSKQYFSKTTLEGLPFFQNLKFMRDTKDEAFLFYRNAFVKITPKGISTHPYTELQGNIWKSQQIDREIKLTDEYDTCDFATFVFRAVTGKKEADIDTNKPEHQVLLKRVISMATAIGYLIHGYKNPAVTKVVLPVDGKVSREKVPNGRSGKSLFFKAIGHVVKMITIDARNFNFNNPHAFSGVTLDTRIIHFNDVPAKFPFDNLFGLITEDFTVNPKNLPSFTIPFAESPKMGVTTNFTPETGGDSRKARQFIVEFTDYFNADRTPKEEFGRLFFQEWDAEEWNRFDNYIINCVHLYLQEGLIDFPLQNFALRQLLAHVPDEFLDFADDLGFINAHGTTESDLQRHDKHELYERFKKENPDFTAMRMNTFTGWLKQWADYKGYDLNPHKRGGRDKSGDKEFITIVKRKAE